MNWFIQDWAGNTMFNGQTFDTFEDGWSHVLQHSPEECWEDIYVEPIEKRREPRRLHLS